MVYYLYEKPKGEGSILTPIRTVLSAVFLFLGVNNLVWNYLSILNADKWSYLYGLTPPEGTLLVGTGLVLGILAVSISAILLINGKKGKVLEIV